MKYVDRLNVCDFRCGYCGEEIHTRYAATYHIKYKHAGMPRNFIQNKADISQYYINRAKVEEEKNQFKIVDTRRVKLPTQNGKSLTKSTTPIERPAPSPVTQPMESPSSIPDYRLLLTWSYYLAAQAACLPSLSQRQPGQTPLPLPTDPEMATKFLQAMQTVMNSSSHPTTKETSDNLSSMILKRERKN